MKKGGIVISASSITDGKTSMAAYVNEALGRILLDSTLN